MKNITVLDSTTQSHGFLLSTVNSPRVNGVIQKKTNPMRFFRLKRTLPGYGAQYMGNFGDAYYYNAASEVVTRRCSAYAKAFAKFKSKAWSDNQVQTAVSLAESREALSMVTGAVMHLVRGARLLRRGRLKAAAEHFGLKTVPKGATRSKQFLDNWMAYRYGWAPTVSDIYDHADAIGAPPSNDFIRAVGRDTWANKSVSSTSYSEGQARVVIKAQVTVDNPVLARLNQFGALNPLEWAWELLPLSFVLDWFVRVGDYLSNISAFVGLKLSECSVTYWYKSTNRLWNSNKYRFDIESKQRIVTSVLPNPPMMFGSGLNPTRAMDALALLQGILRGKRK